MTQVVSIQRKQPTFYVFWHLTDFCNWNCSYCPDHLHSGDYAMGRRPGYPTEAEIEAFMDRIIANLNGRKLWVTLSGGEPTVHPMFARIVQRLKPYGVIGINSNGSRSIKWWQSLPELPSGCTFSLHQEYINKLPHLNELSHWLADSGVDLQYNLVCDPKAWDTVMQLYNGLDPRFFEYVICWPVHDKQKLRNRHVTDYTEEQKIWMRRHQRLFNKKTSIFNPYTSTISFDSGETVEFKNFSETKLKIEGLNRFNGWSCDVGIDSINVNYNGEVFTSICKAQRLGRIDNFELLNNPVSCPFEICIHPADLHVDKRSNETNL